MKIRTFQLAFADSNRTARIRLVPVSGLNSLRNELSNSCGALPGELITIRTLDSFWAEQNINNIDLLKTDTEGFDLEVLKGAEAMLRAQQIQFILAEVTFHPKNSHTRPSFIWQSTCTALNILSLIFMTMTGLPFSIGCR
jgi:FkbM family methyltransferase